MSAPCPAHDRSMPAPYPHVVVDLSEVEELLCSGEQTFQKWKDYYGVVNKPEEVTVSLWSGEQTGRS